jgi:hypothetical protein
MTEVVVTPHIFLASGTQEGKLATRSLAVLAYRQVDTQPHPFREGKGTFHLLRQQLTCTFTATVHYLFLLVEPLVGQTFAQRHACSVQQHPAIRRAYA